MARGSSVDEIIYDVKAAATRSSLVRGGGRPSCAGLGRGFARAGCRPVFGKNQFSSRFGGFHRGFRAGRAVASSHVRWTEDPELLTKPFSRTNTHQATTHIQGVDCHRAVGFARVLHRITHIPQRNKEGHTQ